MPAKSIKQQLKGLAAFSVGIMIALTVFATLASVRQNSFLNVFALSAEETSMASALNQDVSGLLLGVNRYRVSSSPEIAENMQAELERIREKIASHAAEDGTNPEFATLLEDVDSRITEFGARFAHLIMYTNARAELVEAKNTVAQQAEESIVGALEAAATFGDARTTAQLSRIQRDLYRATMLMDRYLLTEIDDTFEAARTAVTLGKEDLDAFDATQLPGPTQSAIPESNELFSEYWAIAEEIRQNIVHTKELRAALDTIGPELTEILSAFVAKEEENLHELGTQSETTTKVTLIVTILVSAGAIFASTLLSRRISSGITRQLRSSIDEMSAVANGDLQAPISQTEAETEIGEMARALEVFRDKAIEARDLQAAKLQEEAANREREAKRQEEERLAEEKRQIHLEEERAAMIASLQDAIGSVVDAAASGDFSKRVDAVFDDTALQQMTQSINLLLENVDAGLNQMVRVMTTLSQGDLTDRISGDHSGVFHTLKTNVNSTIETLSDIVIEISEKCDAVGTQALAMEDQSGSLASRAEQQAASLEETSAAMEEMAASAKSSADGASSAATIAATASQKVENAGEIVLAAVDAMADIKNASDRIGEIVSVIEGIAFQTNLLALNASVEAARAGSAGKGFAVVASEVRALAQRSSEASQDIKSLIEESASQVDRGVDMVENTGKTLKEIVENVKSMADAMNELTSAAREQSVGVQEVTTAVTQLDVITQKNAALADNSRESSTLLKSEAEGMRAIVRRFKTSADSLDQTAALA